MSTTVLTATYDPEADALSIDLEGSGRGHSVRTEHLDDRRFVDYDAQGQIIGIELLDVSSGVLIDGLPEPGLVRGVIERLAGEHGWSAAMPTPSPQTSFSDLESSILRLVAEGASNREIAEKVSLSTEAVRQALDGIYRKLGIKSRGGKALSRES